MNFDDNYAKLSHIQVSSAYITWIKLPLRSRVNAVLFFLLNVIVKNDIHRLEYCFSILRNHSFSPRHKSDYDRARALLKLAHSCSASLVTFPVQMLYHPNNFAELVFGFEFHSPELQTEFINNLPEDLRGATTAANV